MKTVAIMQPYFMPYIGYWQLINVADEFVIYDDVNYIKNGWINRNKLLMAGHESLFTILLDSTSPNQKINEIKVTDDFKKFIKTVGMAYSRAPYKQAVTELIEGICGYDDRNLARFIGNCLQRICDYIGVSTKLIYSSNLGKDNSLKGTEKVLAICRELAAEVYVNAIGGQELYSKDEFAVNGIELKFIQTGEVHYPQFNNEFVPNLSIIDVLMFNPPEKVRELLEVYELV